MIMKQMYIRVTVYQENSLSKLFIILTKDSLIRSRICFSSVIIISLSTNANFVEFEPVPLKYGLIRLIRYNTVYLFFLKDLHINFS